MPVSLRHHRAALSAVLVLLCTTVVIAAPPAAAAATSGAAIEVRLTELVNAARSRHGLGPLRVDVRLVASARSWSAEMQRSGGLGHDPNLGRDMPGSASAWAENVASTTRADDAAGHLHRMLMDSDGHRANILDARFTDVGVGVTVDGDRTYATQRFTAGAPAAVAPAVESLARLSGDVFGAGGADHAVIARDDVFADALAAGPLAGAGGPILLSPPGPALHPGALIALQQILPRGRTVWLVGGIQAVSPEVERELVDGGWDVRRISGETRFTTADAVAKQVIAREGPSALAIVTTGWNWPDAVAGGAYGARAGAPVLLTESDTVSADTRRTLDRIRPERIAVLGGAQAVSERVVGELPATRVAGSTRQGTSAAVAADLWGYRDASPSRWIAVPAFDDDGWTWALGAAPLAARSGAAVLLVGSQLDTDLRSYIDGLGYGGSRTAELITLGPVPASGAEELRSLLR